jgi:hypothetical protein
MDRNVRQPGPAAAAGGPEPPPQEKLLKFFPAEALALYSALEPLARELGKGREHDTLLRVLLWGALAVAVLFCVMYLRRFWQIETPAQLGISAGSLVLYVAALGGPFGTLGWYSPLMGCAAAVIATSFLIFVKAPAPPK